MSECAGKIKNVNRVGILLFCGQPRYGRVSDCLSGEGIINPRHSGAGVVIGLRRGNARVVGVNSRRVTEKRKVKILSNAVASF